MVSGSAGDGSRQERIMEKQQVSLSFCIPVYNAEQYLEQCLSSVTGQEMEDYEVLCVDDCSTDSSPEILRRFAKKYPQVRVVRNEENHGVSWTRNRMIQEAQGEYIWFVDADDLVIPGSASLYVATAKRLKADAVFGKCVVFWGDEVPGTETTGTNAVAPADFKHPADYYPRTQFGTISYGIWNSVFRREYLLEKGFRFREDFRNMEDLVFYFELGRKIQNAFRIDHYGYFYRVREGSASHGSEQNRRHYESSVRFLPVIDKALRDSEIDYRDSILAHRIERQEAAASYLCRCSDTGFVRAELKKMKDSGWYPYRHDSSIEYYTRSRKKKILANYLLPFEPTFWILHFYYRHQGGSGK